MPVAGAFQKQVQPDFSNTPFTAQGDKLVFSSGMLSRGSHARMMKKLEAAVADSDVLHEQDVGLPLAQRFGCSMVLAWWVWEFEALRKLRKNGVDKVFLTLFTQSIASIFIDLPSHWHINQSRVSIKLGLQA